MTSTAALFRSVKYIRPLALSTPAMSKEKLLVDVIFGTAMSAFTLTPLELPCVELLLPPQLPPKVIAAINSTPRICSVLMVFLLEPEMDGTGCYALLLEERCGNSMPQHLRYQSF